MDITNKINDIVEKIFVDDGLDADKPSSYLIRDLISENYLSDEFSEFEHFKKNEKENILPPGTAELGWEKTRRKIWTGKNKTDGLTDSEKKILKDLKKEVKKVWPKAVASASPSAAPILELNYLINKISELQGFSTERAQLDRFLLISDDCPQLNGLFNKEDFKEFFKPLMLNFFRNRIKNSTELATSLLWLRALFNKEESGYNDYAKFIELINIFSPYFDINSPADQALSTLGLFQSMDNFFRNIEVEKSRKGMYNDIGYDAATKKSRRDNHISIASQIAFSDYAIEYKEEKFIELLKQLETPFMSPDTEDDQYYRKYFNNDFSNNLASALAKKYGDDEAIKILFSGFLSSIGYEDEEIQRYLYLFIFPSLDFSNCAPEPEIKESVSEDICYENYYDSLPADWTQADTNTIFFDEKTCSYAISFVTDYENTSKKTIKDIQKEYKKQISQEILFLLGKQTDEESLKKIIHRITFKSYFINPKPLLKIRLLVLINKEVVEDILDASSVEEVDGTPVAISYNIERFFSNIESFANIMTIFERRRVIDMFRGNSVYYTDLNFDREAAEMREFSVNLSKVLRPIEIHDTIKISFLGNRIVGLELTKAGYKKRRIVNGLMSFVTSSPQTRERTVNFVKSLQQMIDFYTDSGSAKYDIFIQKFFRPVPPVRETKNSIMDQANGSPNPVGFASMDELVARGGDFLLSEVKRGFTSFSCLSDNERKQVEDRAADEEEKEKKKKFGERMTLQIEDAFFAQVPEIFDQIATGDSKKALNKLGRDFLGRLGVCGLGDLVALAANALLSSINPEEYMDELVKCAISKMDPKTAKKFFNKVMSDNTLEAIDSSTGFMDSYRKAVGDTLLPWDSSPPGPTGVRPLNVNTLDAFKNQEIKDYDLRIRSLGSAIVISFDTRQLLNLLSGFKGAEYIKFFIEIIDSVIKKCKVVNDGDGILTNVSTKAETTDYCSGDKSKIKWPKFKKAKKTKKKSLGDIIAENAEELIINLTVKLITFSFSELMKMITGALSMDSEFLKSGPNVPPFLGDGEYFYNIIRESSEKTSITDSQINELLAGIMVDMNLADDSQDFTNEALDNFLTNTSMVLNPKQKINLLKGEAPRSVRGQILEASPSNGITRALKSDPSKIGDIFEKFGQNVNISNEEQKLENAISATRNSDFCLSPPPRDPHSDALRAKGATEEEIGEQKKEKLEREKEKLCNLMDMMSNPVAPIFGNALAKLFKKDGPIFGLLDAEKFKLFKIYAEQELSLLSIPFDKDLNDPKDGFLQLMLHGKIGYAYDRKDLKNDNVDGRAYEFFQYAMSNEYGTRFEYSPYLDDNSYYFKFYEERYGEKIGSDESISLKESDDGLNKIYIGKRKISDFKRKHTNVEESQPGEISGVPDSVYWAYSPADGEKAKSFNWTASNMYGAIFDSLGPSSLSEYKREDMAEDIVKNTMPNLIERYYGSVKREMLSVDAFSYEDWESIHSKFNKEKILKLFNIDNMLDKNLIFYQKLEPDDRIGKKKKLIYEGPFDNILLKEDYIRVAIMTEMIIKSYTLEAIMKSFFSFRTFSEGFFPTLDILSSYITRHMREDLAFNYSLFSQMSLQVYLKKIDLGIQEIVNEDASKSYSALMKNRESFINMGREDIQTFMLTNHEYIDDLIADYSELVISSTIESFKNAFSSRNIHMDQFALGPMVENGPRHVVENIKKSENFEEISGTYYWDTSTSSTAYTPPSDYKKTRIIMEKFIYIEDKENIPSHIKQEIEGRPDWLYGVVNIDAWKKYLEKHETDFSPYFITDLWASWKFGLRLSYIMPRMTEGCENSQINKAYNIKFNDEEVSLLPMATVMVDIENQEITPDIMNDFDLSCLVYDLTNSREYKKLFTDIIDIETLISLITIYSVNEFNIYLGKGTNTVSDLNRWQKNPKSFQNIKKASLDILKDLK